MAALLFCCAVVTFHLGLSYFVVVICFFLYVSCHCLSWAVCEQDARKAGGTVRQELKALESCVRARW